MKCGTPAQAALRKTSVAQGGAGLLAWGVRTLLSGDGAAGSCLDTFLPTCQCLGHFLGKDIKVISSQCHSVEISWLQGLWGEKGSWLHRMGLPVSWAPSALWVLGCCALLLWLWSLCTACRRPEDTLAPRKRVRRQRARLQGSAMGAEAVSARLSRGPGRGPQGTDQPSSPPVPAEADPPLLPQQVGHQTARAAPGPAQQQG